MTSCPSEQQTTTYRETSRRHVTPAETDVYIIHARSVLDPSHARKVAQLQQATYLHDGERLGGVSPPRVIVLQVKRKRARKGTDVKLGSVTSHAKILSFGNAKVCFSTGSSVIAN